MCKYFYNLYKNKIIDRLSLDSAVKKSWITEKEKETIILLVESGGE